MKLRITNCLPTEKEQTEVDSSNILRKMAFIQALGLLSDAGTYLIDVCAYNFLKKKQTKEV